MSWVGIAGKLLPRFIRQRIVLGRIRSELQTRIGKDATEGIMTGWKTKASGLLAILTGAAIVVKEIADGSFNFDEIFKGLGVISGGLGVIGIGHKIDKAGNAAATGVSTTKGDA